MEKQRIDRQHMYDRSSRRPDPGCWSSRCSDGMVATAHYLATEAGVEALVRGGNAVDAAVAASLALGVCEPAGSGLGGMAMMTLHLADPGRTFVLPGACRAPSAATPEEVEKGGRYRGCRAVAVPGNPAVLGHAHGRYGCLGREELFDPAIRLAEEGFPLTELQHRLIGQYRKALAQGSAGRIFLNPDGTPLPAGYVMRHPGLARTLRRLAREGFDEFYHGETARKMAADLGARGGFVSVDDLESYPVPRETEPVRVPFRDGELCTAGPPAGGMALAQMAALFETMVPSGFDADTPEGAVLLARIIRRARADRRRYRLKAGSEEPGAAMELLARECLDAAAADIGSYGSGSGETSHIVAADRDGNVVSMTQSIERSFGAAEVAEGLGFLYNGFMRAFKVQNRRHPHYLRPGAAARSNAAPTILLKDGRPYAAIGSTGSERMCSGIFGVLVRLERKDPFGAVHAPRLHCTPEGLVQIEAGRCDPQCLAALEQAGFTLERLDDYAFSMGGLQLIVREGEDWCGVGEPRRDAAAAGP